jgi:hypothetical protein
MAGRTRRRLFLIVAAALAAAAAPRAPTISLSSALSPARLQAHSAIGSLGQPENAGPLQEH